MTKTKRLLSGVLSTSLALAACSSPEQVEYETIDETSEPLPAEKEPTPYTYDREVELDAYEDDFPNVDLEAVEDYLEDNNIAYDEAELLDYLEDLNENGQPNEEHHFASGFPWWLFLLSAKSSKPKSSKSKTTTQTQKPSTSSSSKSSTSSSGFGTGTKGGMTGS
ncbi:hypothetical protein [Bacillus taeanensis]|uniref:Lipoprotein n=1 Tax=Bacillus taeanensis TaxID=273032 RepID=A0A366XPZ1_9BACI|nr:hypothetical protein [Bacillus taeanensis]RBW67977.1 hypothetical protein DS031_19425 [Bacillus taeanensis]